MEISNDVVKYLELLLNVVFVILPTLAAMAMLTPLGKYVISAVIAGWKWFRPNVDEANDSLVLGIAKRTGRTPEEVLELLTGNMDRLMLILSEAQPKGG